MGRGLYNTKQKNLLMKFFVENKSELFFAKDILEKINLKNYKMGLTTIYRLLDSLVNNNILMVFYGDFGKKFGYFPCENTDHFHLICIVCGNVKHIECDSFFKLIDHVNTNHSFHLLSNEIFLKGRCMKCF